MKWWTKSWNPMTGCTKCSPGCDNCYAHTEADRLAKMGAKVYQEHGFKPTFHPDRLEAPLKWKKPEVVFVNSMSDVFHDDFSAEEIGKVLGVIQQAPQHQFLICTKRIDRAFSVTKDYDWPDNLWMGVTAENEEMAYERISELMELPAKHRFVSVEPLLGEVSLRDWLMYDFRCYQCGYIGDECDDCCEHCGTVVLREDVDPMEGIAECPECGKVNDFESDRSKCCPQCFTQGGYYSDFGMNENHNSSDKPTLDWVICGGENGQNARPMETEWADEILDQCQASGTPFFYKGAGSYDRKRDLRGQQWTEMPKAIAEIFNERMKK